MGASGHKACGMEEDTRETGHMQVDNRGGGGMEARGSNQEERKEELWNKAPWKQSSNGSMTGGRMKSDYMEVSGVETTWMEAGYTTSRQHANDLGKRLALMTSRNLKTLRLCLRCSTE